MRNGQAVLRESAPPPPSIGRTLLLAFAVGLAVVAVLLFALGGRATLANRSWSLDFNLNWVAAHRLIERQPLYVPAQAQRTGIALAGQDMHGLNRDPFNSYISTPVVALAHVPFVGFDHETAKQLFRMMGIIEMVLALWITACALPRSRRVVAFLLAVAALCCDFPMVISIAAGQMNGMIMLALAIGIWGTSRERWGIAGAGLGFAAVLKVTPVILLIYLVLRGRREVFRSAILTMLGCLGLSAAVGRPTDILVWARDVTPQISKGTIDVYNQSIVGTLARITSPGTDLGSHAALGRWFVFAYLIWMAGISLLWYWRRNRPLQPMELGLLVLVVILSGPLSWDHYFTWVAIPLVLMFGSEAWARFAPLERTAIAIGFVWAIALMNARVPLPRPSAVAANWWLRVTTAPYTASAMILIAIALWILARTEDRRPARAQPQGAADTRSLEEGRRFSLARPAGT